ncbi:MAG: DUF998 domain-containing protein [Lysobacteraceae bacterium]|nr:MAG: DUF998 domain-containing protein [Xanthomonadaceae bacterium]
MSRILRLAGPLALLSFVLAAGLAGAALDGYSHREYPLAYLGARGVPGACWFNVFAFAIPGLLVFAALQSLRETLPARARWQARIGAQIAALSALAFAAMGLFSLDPETAASDANGLHATAWTLWWIAFAAGGSLLALGGMGRRVVVATAIATSVVIALTTPIWSGVMSAYAPRLAFLCWLVWSVAIARFRD